MYAVITKPVVDNAGFTVFSVGQVVEGRLMCQDLVKLHERGLQWADRDWFVTKVNDFEYAIDPCYFKRTLRMRIYDLFKRKRKQ